MNTDFKLLEKSASAEDFQKRLAHVCFHNVIPPSLQVQLTESQKKSVAAQIKQILSGTLTGPYRSGHDVQIFLRLWDSQEVLASKLGQIDLNLPKKEASKELSERARHLMGQLIPWIRETFEAAAYKTASAESYYQRR